MSGSQVIGDGSRRTLVIANPRSRAGATGRAWNRLSAKLREVLGAIEVEQTRGPRDAERIAREGVRAGIERLIVVGGDGTVSEVVTGLLSAGLGGYAQLGVVPSGTGGDLLRTYGLPRDPDRALARLAQGKARPVDAGRVDYRASTGRPARAYFLNVASAGMSGLTTALVNRAPKMLGGRLSFFIGAVRSIFTYRSAPVSIRADGAPFHEGPLILATVANGQYFGGGMHIAPKAKPDDGLLDLVVVPQVSRSQLLSKLPSLYRGTHLSHPAVGFRRARVVEIDAEPGAVWLELDGEPLGQLPATFEVLPGAIQLIGAGAP